VSLPPRMAGTRGRVTGATTFDEATFEARLHELKFLPGGECRIVLLVPEDSSDQAVAMKDAYACALQVRVEKQSHG